jgi:hypothetical protein
LIEQKKSFIYYFETDVPKNGEITRTLEADTALETMANNPVIELVCNQELCKSRININNKDKDQIDYSDKLAVKSPHTLADNIEAVYPLKFMSQGIMRSQLLFMAISKKIMALEHCLCGELEKSSRLG